jgi:4-carboxymuconolactone decarboxylase
MRPAKRLDHDRDTAGAMPRIDMPNDADMTAEQRVVCDETIAGRRGHVPVPLRAWLASPEFARRAQHLGEFVRYKTSLPPRLSELAILVTARHWTAQYEWYAHKTEALKAGLDDGVIDAIAEHRPPAFRSDDERLVYDFSRRLHEDHAVDDDLYRSAVTVLGEHGVVELVGLLGYYTLVAMTLNTFEFGVPEGAPPLR